VNFNVLLAKMKAINALNARQIVLTCQYVIVLMENLRILIEPAWLVRSNAKNVSQIKTTALFA